MNTATALIGSHWFLMEFPIWATPILVYFLAVNVLFIGRYFFEGLDYNISWSSQQGDLALTGVITLAAYLLHTMDFPPPAWLESWKFHLPVALICFSIGSSIQFLVYKRDGNMGPKMDAYHNTFVWLMMGYLVFTSVPVILVYGSNAEIVSMFSLGAVWIACVLYDAKKGRLNQRTWLKRHGVSFDRRTRRYFFY